MRNVTSSHQLGTNLRAASDPEIVIVPTTINHAPRKIATATTPGPGHAMIAIPTAIESRPATTLARLTRASKPAVSDRITPSTMNSAPRKAARLLTVQSMLKMSTPATISAAPLSSSLHQLLAMLAAAWRVSLCVKSGSVPGVKNMRFLQDSFVTAFVASLVPGAHRR